ILEEVCKKQGYTSQDYAIKHQRKIVDETLPVRYSGLSNNAHLELVPHTKTSTTGACCTVGLQLASGDRLVKEFPPTHSLWDVISHWDTDDESVTEERKQLLSTPCDRVPLVFSETAVSDTGKSEQDDDLPDSFFEVTVDDLRKMLQDLHSERIGLVGYDLVGYVLLVSMLTEFVKSCLADPSTPFYLFTAFEAEQAVFTINGSMTSANESANQTNISNGNTTLTNKSQHEAKSSLPSASQPVRQTKDRAQGAPKWFKGTVIVYKGLLGNFQYDVAVLKITQKTLGTRMDHPHHPYTSPLTGIPSSHWMCSYIAGLTVSELVNKTVTMCDTCEADRSNDDLHLKKKKLEIELAEQKEILNNMKKTEADLDREIELLKQELEEAKTKPATAETACQASVEVTNSEVQTICASTNECETQTEVTNTIKVTQETQTDPLPMVSA
ncbi:predicted protein, partial [Nematostella vectensis]